MRELWKRWSAKIDERTPRERGLAFVIGALALVLIVYAAALQPLLRQQRAHVERIRQDESQLRALTDALLKHTQQAAIDPFAAKRERLRDAEQKLALSEQQLSERRSKAAAPEDLAGLLRDLVGRNPGVRLVSLRVIPPVEITSRSAPAPQPGPRPLASAQFYRHAVEIEMSGPYLELLKYLETLGALPWDLNWGGIEIHTVSYPQIRLRATVYTLSPSPTFIRL
jgi:MSHA biogenesis protein MshJ